MYKTRRAYGRYEDKLLAGLGKMIDEFIEHEKPGKFLSSGYRTGKMTADVGKWLKAIGAKDMTTPSSIFYKSFYKLHDTLNYIFLHLVCVDFLGVKIVEYCILFTKTVVDAVGTPQFNKKNIFTRLRNLFTACNFRSFPIKITYFK